MDNQKFEIELKYKKPLTGRLNKLVYQCLECRVELLAGERFGSVYDHICGFADSNIGNLAIVECPNCFNKWTFHSRVNEKYGGSYPYFLESIEYGKNVHFKKQDAG